MNDRERPEDNSAAASLDMHIENGLAWITMNNPRRMNALTSAMWRTLPEAITEAVRNDAVRVIILRGAGTRAFSAGADISEFETARTGDAAAAYDKLNDDAFSALINCPKPTLAMIHGFCMGGGLGLALSCDIRIADDASQYAIPAAKLGLGYNARWVRPILNAVKPARAKELLFTGRRYPATEAVAMGLVSRVVTADALEAETLALARDIANNAPLTVAAAKCVIDEIARHPEEPDMVMMDAMVQRCFDSDDYAEGRRAFLEKRKPEFKGR